MILIGIAVLAFATTACPDPQRDAAGAAARAYLEKDFDADGDRGLRVRFSPERKAQEERVDSYGGELFDCEWQPFVVVASYRVVEVTCDGTHAGATVEFCRVGKSGRLLDLQAEDRSKEVVNLALEQVGAEWRVVDPPEPRVSISAAQRSVEAFLKRTSGPKYESEARARNSAGEHAVRARNVRAAEKLRDMARAGGFCGEPAR